MEELKEEAGALKEKANSLTRKRELCKIMAMEQAQHVLTIKSSSLPDSVDNLKLLFEEDGNKQYLATNWYCTSFSLSLKRSLTWCNNLILIFWIR